MVEAVIVLLLVVVVTLAGMSALVDVPVRLTSQVRDSLGAVFQGDGARAVEADPGVTADGAAAPLSGSGTAETSSLQRIIPAAHILRDSARARDNGR